MAEPIDHQCQMPPEMQQQGEAHTHDHAAPPDKPFIRDGLLKGLAVTALVFVAVMGLVIGTMGTGSIGNLFVDGTLVTSFGEGLGHGISKASEFLVTSWIGGAALAVGGALGIYREYKNTQKEAALAPDSQNHTNILELTQELEAEKSMNRQLVTMQEKLMEQQAKDVSPKTPGSKAPENELKAETAPNAANQKQEGQKQDAISLPGSVIEDRDFRACELKRRVERVHDGDARVI